jgi:hypothetical protein
MVFAKSHEWNFSYGIEMVQLIHMQYMTKYFIKCYNYLNILRKYLHFVVYWYRYYFFIDLLFNHLLSMKNVVFLDNCIIW